MSRQSLATAGGPCSDRALGAQRHALGASTTMLRVTEVFWRDRKISVATDFSMLGARTAAQDRASAHGDSALGGDNASYRVAHEAEALCRNRVV